MKHANSVCFVSSSGLPNSKSSGSTPWKSCIRSEAYAFKNPGVQLRSSISFFSSL